MSHSVSYQTRLSPERRAQIRQEIARRNATALAQICLEQLANLGDDAFIFPKAVQDLEFRCQNIAQLGS